MFVQDLMSRQHIMASFDSFAICTSVVARDPARSPRHLAPVAARSAAVFRALYDVAHELMVQHADTAMHFASLLTGATFEVTDDGDGRRTITCQAK